MKPSVFRGPLAVIYLVDNKRPKHSVHRPLQSGFSRRKEPLLRPPCDFITTHTYVAVVSPEKWHLLVDTASSAPSKHSRPPHLEPPPARPCAPFGGTLLRSWRRVFRNPLEHRPRSSEAASKQDACFETSKLTDIRARTRT